MSAIFVEPLPFVTASGSTTPLAGSSVANLTSDIAGLVWRAWVSSSLVVDLGPNPVSYDVIAMIGSNLRASDVVTISTGPTTAASAWTSGAGPAWSGNKPKQYSAKTILKLPAQRSDRYIKITFAATGHPDAFVQFQRLVVGKAVSNEGVRYGAKMHFEDRSMINIGSGFTQIDRYDVLPAWEVELAGVSDEKWRAEWAPLLMYAGASRGVLFVRDIDKPTSYQTDAIFGRISSKATGEAKNYDSWVMSCTVLSFAP